MYSPKGRVVRRMRLMVAGETVDGAKFKLIIPGAGVVVHVRSDAESRRTFGRLAQRLGIITVDVTEEEDADGEVRSGSYVERDGTFNRRSGKRVRAEHAVPTAFQCVSNDSNIPAIRELVAHPCVAGWGFAVSVRIPVGARGSGPEKARPGMGSAFGRPAQVAATAVQLAHDRTTNTSAARKAGEL